MDLIYILRTISMLTNIYDFYTEWHLIKIYVVSMEYMLYIDYVIRMALIDITLHGNMNHCTDHMIRIHEYRSRKIDLGCNSLSYGDGKLLARLYEWVSKAMWIGLWVKLFGRAYSKFSSPYIILILIQYINSEFKNNQIENILRYKWWYLNNFIRLSKFIKISSM